MPTNRMSVEQLLEARTPKPPATKETCVACKGTLEDAKREMAKTGFGRVNDPQYMDSVLLSARGFLSETAGADYFGEFAKGLVCQSHLKEIATKDEDPVFRIVAATAITDGAFLRNLLASEQEQHVRRWIVETLRKITPLDLDTLKNSAKNDPSMVVRLAAVRAIPVTPETLDFMKERAINEKDDLIRGEVLTRIAASPQGAGVLGFLKERLANDTAYHVQHSNLSHFIKLKEEREREETPRIKRILGGLFRGQRKREPESS